MMTWRAMANEISLPLNQRPTTVVTATMKSSEPTPSTKRPAIIAPAGAAGTTAGSTAMSRPPAAPIAPNSTDRAARAEPVDEHSAGHEGQQRGHVVRRVEEADLRVGEPELALQQRRHRRERVEDVVAAEHRQAAGDEDAPAEGGRRRERRRLARAGRGLVHAPALYVTRGGRPFACPLGSRDGPSCSAGGLRCRCRRGGSCPGRRRPPGRASSYPPPATSLQPLQLWPSNEFT